jgi:hypothetical protein
MNTLNDLGKNALGVKNFFRGIEENIHREQREILFHRKSWEDEENYFNFIKFLFSNPGKV